MIEQRFIDKKQLKDKQAEDEAEERRRKAKPLDQNSPNIELGVVGVSNAKKREKTVAG